MGECAFHGGWHVLPRGGVVGENLFACLDLVNPLGCAVGHEDW
ncbi:Hypothetical protein PROPAUS_2745, partial [Propionibacterium australiense]